MPRAGLTRATVVAAAADLADEVGWERLTLAALAGRLGVRLPSLYKHIASFDALRRDVAVLAVTELGDAMTAAAVGRAGPDALRSVAAAYRRYGQGHPGRYPATVRAPAAEDEAHTAAAATVLRIVLAVLAGYGLDDTDAIDAARALRASLHGFVTLEAGGGFGMPYDVDRSYDRLIDGFDAMLHRWSDAVPPQSPNT
jgi:AcrR family transcriptional regulator